MRITIAARQSALARIQAEAVGAALQSAHAKLEIDYHFRASLGDQRADDPLWQMPEKGVFTEDFRAGLLAGECDLVVHSWKDLPLDTGAGTIIAATLPRADQRDLLLVRQDRWAQRMMGDERPFTLLTSSPRRARNLAAILPQALPVPIAQMRCLPVRGTIQTRVSKLWQRLADGTETDGLVVAKAAMDRLMSVSDTRYADTQVELHAALSQCRWMVLPLSVNPTAPAQGALALEIAAGRTDLQMLCQPIHCAETFANVGRERDILRAHGGGCHLPLGVSILRRAYGEIAFVRGWSNDETAINENVLSPTRPRPQPLPLAQLWPHTPAENEWFTREPLQPLDPSSLAEAHGLWVAKAEALPADYRVASTQLVWAGGWQTWRRLAQRGVWVNGCTDGLGEDELPMIEALTRADLHWCKLTHTSAATLLNERRMPTVVTYQLQPCENVPDLTGREMFYWTSGSNFVRALSRAPWLKEKTHACGPGHTQKIIERAGLQPHIFLSREMWLQEMAI